MAKRVLVTGGRGFAGRHTIEHLLATTDWHITTLERPRHQPSISDRLVQLPHDLRKPIPDWLSEDWIGHVDAVIHLAASADVHQCLKAPSEHVLNNVGGVLTMLEWARSRRLSHFVLVSTNEVYGPTLVGPDGKKEWSPIIPATPYSGSKAAQEALAISWWRTFDVPVVITNTMQLFGIGQPNERFIPTVVRHLTRGEPVPVYALWTGSEWRSASRCWTYVNNHADALRWILSRGPQASPSRPARWNIAGPELSCERLVRRIAELLGVEPEFEFVESDTARPGHELRYSLDTTKIHDAGWSEPFDFDYALAETVTELARGKR